jgi:hypothetical protein
VSAVDDEPGMTRESIGVECLVSMLKTADGAGETISGAWYAMPAAGSAVSRRYGGRYGRSTIWRISMNSFSAAARRISRNYLPIDHRENGVIIYRDVGYIFGIGLASVASVMESRLLGVTEDGMERSVREGQYGFCDILGNKGGIRLSRKNRVAAARGETSVAHITAVTSKGGGHAEIDSRYYLQVSDGAKATSVPQRRVINASAPELKWRLCCDDGTRGDREGMFFCLPASETRLRGRRHFCCSTEENRGDAS